MINKFHIDIIIVRQMDARNFNYFMNNDQLSNKSEDGSKVREEETASCVGLHNELNLKFIERKNRTFCLHLKILFIRFFYIIRCYCVHTEKYRTPGVARLLIFKNSQLYFFILFYFQCISISVV